MEQRIGLEQRRIKICKSVFDASFSVEILLTTTEEPKKREPLTTDLITRRLNHRRRSHRRVSSPAEVALACVFDPSGPVVEAKRHPGCHITGVLIITSVIRAAEGARKTGSAVMAPWVADGRTVPTLPSNYVTVCSRVTPHRAAGQTVRQDGYPHDMGKPRGRTSHLKVILSEFVTR